MIRIQGGEWRGRRIHPAPGSRTRPSAGRLRESLFQALGSYVEEYRWADLFAGAGSLGIEALSRGAPHCRFVEIDPRTLVALRRNLESLGVPADRHRVHRGDARRWLAKIERGDIVDLEALLVDPPYDAEDAAGLLKDGLALVESERVVLFVLEHAADIEFPEELEEASDAVVFTTRVHGHGAFTLIERKRP